METKPIILRLLPLIIFSFIVISSGVVLYEFKKKPTKKNFLTSQLIGKKIPDIEVQEADYKIENNNKNVNFKEYKNKFYAVNFFASWCAPCRIEAPIVEDLSKIIPIIGIAYKDEPIDTKKFLDEFGNPYDKIGLDNSGKIAIEWGVYGVPETFLINDKGEIIYRHAGPLLYNIFKSEVLPIIKSNKK